MNKRLLLAFNGSKGSIPAVDYGVWLAEQIRVPVTLLGVIEKISMRKDITKVIESATVTLEAAGINFQTRIVSGKCSNVIPQNAREDQHLTIFGPFDRPVFHRWLRGRSFRRVFQEISTPVIYVKRAHLQLSRILVCVGGLGYALSAERLSLFLAQCMAASVTILHIIEPISYEYPTAQDIQNRWEDITDTNTPQGKNIAYALQMAKDMGIAASLYVRHGVTVREILYEISSHSYDMIVLGSTSSSKSLRHFFMPNVTAEIAEAVDCPVLIVRPGQESAFTNAS